MTRERPILIAGGGIGGLAAALALVQAGFSAHVLERRPAFSEEGAGIQLGPNAMRVLDRLGVARRLEAAAGVPEAILVHEGYTGRVLQRLPLGAWMRARHGAPYWLVHRHDLQTALLATVGDESRIRLTSGFEVGSWVSTATGVTAVSRDGATVEGAALIGADGTFSRVRHQLLGVIEPRYSGMLAARTVVAADQVSPRLDTTCVGVWLAPGAHVVHYPVRGGREIAVIVVTPDSAARPGWALPVAPADMMATLVRFAPRLREALNTATQWKRWALYELDPLARWTRGRVTLLGDAAHPTLPFLAQGGALALEDAAVLADCLQLTPDIATALAAYEGARRPRVDRVVAAARQNGRIFHLSGLAERIRNAGLRLLPPGRVMARYDWVYGWRA
jgi:salicylate hydroxylase